MKLWRNIYLELWDLFFFLSCISGYCNWSDIYRECKYLKVSKKVRKRIEEHLHSKDDEDTDILGNCLADEHAWYCVTINKFLNFEIPFNICGLKILKTITSDMKNLEKRELRIIRGIELQNCLNKFADRYSDSIFSQAEVSDIASEVLNMAINCTRWTWIMLRENQAFQWILYFRNHI